jgi:hypothetical protein
LGLLVEEQPVETGAAQLLFSCSLLLIQMRLQWPRAAGRDLMAFIAPFDEQMITARVPYRRTSRSAWRCLTHSAVFF